MSEESLYSGREQTLIKHFILQQYLKRFAHIIGFHWQTITYVDCFSGPWNVRSNELKDSSFAIALDELRAAKKTHLAKGKTLNLRCMFLEKDPTAYSRLKEFADGITDVQVETRNKELSQAIDDVLGFIRDGGRGSFPFIFDRPYWVDRLWTESHRPNFAIRTG
jgi:three-Cys-motif partner protein